MKKMCARLWAGALLLVFLSGCSSKGEGRTAEEWTELYQQVITEHGGEMVEYNPVISRFDAEDGTSALALSSLGLEEGDVEAFGASVSVMNTQAYAIAAVQPAEGREEAVQTAASLTMENTPCSTAWPVPQGRCSPKRSSMRPPGGRHISTEQTPWKISFGV